MNILKSIATFFFIISPITSRMVRMVLPDEEKFEFVKTFGSWIEGRDIRDSCFTLNFGFEAPLPWPQVELSRAYPKI